MKKAYISKSLFPPPNYAHSVKVNSSDYLFTAGVVPLDKSGVLVGKGSVEQQTIAIIQNLERVLLENGFTLRQIVKMTIFVVASDRGLLSTVWDELKRLGITSPQIAATLVGVSCLGYQDQLVEIEVIAAK
jgi:2-iminobutanoate/2-iminopropanoate deaminase